MSYQGQWTGNELDETVGFVRERFRRDGNWVEVPDYAVNVKDFGAVGDGVADDGPAIQAALDSVRDNGGGEVFVPSGIYAYYGLYDESDGTIEGSNTWLKKEYYNYFIPSNCRLKLAPDAVMVRMADDVGNGWITNYTNGEGNSRGAFNIEICGGTWDGNAPATSGNNTCINIGQATNVYIHDTVIKDNNRHHIEVNSSRHVRIERVVFDTMVNPSSGTEAIQLDGAFNQTVYKTMYPSPYDDTTNHDVHIVGCVFWNTNCAIGTHSQSDGRSHENIIVERCHFEHDSEYSHGNREILDFRDYDQVLIRGNYFKNVPTAIYIYNRSNGERGQHRIVDNVCEGVFNTDVVIDAEGNGSISDVVISGNHFGSIQLDEVSRVIEQGNFLGQPTTTTGATVDYQSTNNFVGNDWVGSDTGSVEPVEPGAEAMFLVAHGDDADALRPSGFAGGTWVGEVEPLNWSYPDVWLDVTDMSWSIAPQPGAGTEPEPGDYHAEVITDAPVAYYQLLEESGDVAAEYNGDHDGVYESMTLGEEAPLGLSAVEATEDASRIVVPDSPALSFGDTQACTLEALIWVSPEGGTNRVSDRAHIFRKGSYGHTDFEYLFRIQDFDAHLRFQINSGPGGTESWAQVDSVPKETWLHVAAVYDSGVMRIYVNGVESAVNSSAVSMFRPSEDIAGLAVGGETGLADEDPFWGGIRGGFNGLLASPAVYDYALSAERIAAHAAAAGLLDD
ncbi:LamG-like jellyroll fold domain-containing protein [Halorhodospira sp. 9622]|uniref:LamG-like jellyroll fold domain-containing protein n=1 Tax=Halorhodospira sp. 9622 TaxID=2899136 RepID=UPI001EE8973D|nr:LamG-like jellyroll fold domain-containing protein [Halorhodospira sp. 9622]MCG5537859.1 hypothetical protein [Halorhodospira sp. 9622]